ncbi:Secreted protein acidic and rich in cysteine [Chionoecetes opilio]|uniref:Secreted protein acidic and rich in cysteine n=1 Tax=Chionoecetes opilio TaxID=41210 RepID=A0A8J4YKW5_CHIOP|nr:Secreted protein acidic and rich in cysteine [Chionoecetes opilio]
MRLLWVLVAAVLVVGTSASVASKKSHQKKTTTEAEKKHLDIEKRLEEVQELEAELEKELEAEEEEETSDEENEMTEEQVGEEEAEEEAEALPVEDYHPEIRIDPCHGIYCGAGRMCVPNDEDEGECVCVNVCEHEDDVRRRVCSNNNETWMSDCELYRQRCLCQEEDESCLSPDNKHVHIEYYGACQDMPECVEEELEDFPRRMSEWLFHIMRDMADRETLSEHYVRLEREAEEDPKKQWSYAVVWKWCELDSHPKDKAVSLHELFPLRAPLFTLENCVAAFLESCDANSDHSITLREWATCTKLSEDDLEKFETFCESIRDE